GRRGFGLGRAALVRDQTLPASLLAEFGVVVVVSSTVAVLGLPRVVEFVELGDQHLPELLALQRGEDVALVEQDFAGETVPVVARPEVAVAASAGPAEGEGYLGQVQAVRGPGEQPPAGACL